MSIFDEMHDKNHFDSIREFDQLRRMLSEAIERGYVEEVPVFLTGRNRIPGPSHWYRDRESGEIYSLSAPEAPSTGSWEKVGMEELKKSGETIH